MEENQDNLEYVWKLMNEFVVFDAMAFSSWLGMECDIKIDIYAFLLLHHLTFYPTEKYYQ